MNRKILFVNDIGEWGGAEKILLQVLEMAKETPVLDPSLVVGSEGALAEKARGLFVPVRTLPLPSRRDSPFPLLLWGWRVAGEAGKEPPDLAYFNNIRSIVFASPFFWMRGIPVVWHEHNIEEGLPHIVLNILGAFVPERIIAVSRAVSRAYWPFVRKRKVKVVHNGLELSNFPREPVGDLRKEFNIPPREKIVTMASVLKPWKGQADFIKSADIVRREYPRVKFLILGKETEKGYEEELLNLCRSLKLRKKVIFTGWRDDAPDIILQSDIVVLASRRPEPFGLVILEAMAGAKPVIATRAGGVPEIVKEGKTGLLVDPGEFEAMAEAVLELLCQQKTCREMGEAGFLRVRNFFSGERFKKEMEEILANLLNKKV